MSNEIQEFVTKCDECFQTRFCKTYRNLNLCTHKHYRKRKSIWKLKDALKRKANE